MLNHDLMEWLRSSGWHYCLRLPSDVLLHGLRRYPIAVGSVYPPLGEARLYRHVGLWQDGIHRCHLVLATVKGAKESWAVITNESPSLQTPIGGAVSALLKIGLRWLKGVLHKGRELRCLPSHSCPSTPNPVSGTQVNIPNPTAKFLSVGLI